MRPMFNQVSTATAMTFGVPGFFSPRLLPPLLAPDGSNGALSFYDTTPLQGTLEELVDSTSSSDSTVRLLARRGRAAHRQLGVFRQHARRDRAEHVMASGALPPGFPPVQIDGELYWDGGIVSNSPLWYVLDETADEALIIQVDVFSARGELPKNLAEVLERAKDIQYSSKTRFNTNRVKEIEDDARRAAPGARQAAESAARGSPTSSASRAASKPATVSLVHLINRRYSQHRSPRTTNSRARP